MPYLPTITTEYSTQEITDVFAGYNHNLKIADGEMYDMTNLCSDYYPLMASRPRRGYVRELDSPMGIIGKSALAWVDDGTLFYNGAATAVTGLEDGEKQLVSMGAYICVFPDGAWYNTADGTHGSMNAVYASSGNVRYAMCKLDGTEYEDTTISDIAPAEPANGELWIDTSQTVHILKQWAQATNEWASIATTYIKITFGTRGILPQRFSANDGVTISGSIIEGCNGNKLIKTVGGDSGTEDFIIVTGLLDQETTQSSGTVGIRRDVPELDYVCEAQNRLWGCRYSDGINELYCCALGDFRNWERYEGISTDSWRASIGSDGEWTGCVNYMGYPTFFKRDRIYRISVSSTGAHSVSETVCRGVQPGSDKSLAVVNETLFYKSDSDVCAYQGGFPSGISGPLGTGRFSSATAGTVKDKYYISMVDEHNATHLFCFDTRNKLWIREDELRCEWFARVNDELYAISGRKLIALLGSEGTQEPYVQWTAESGMLYYKAPERKYVSRFNIRVQMEEGAEIELYIRYDEEKEWLHKGTIKTSRNRTVTIPVRPKRCDHLRIRLTGKGDFRLFSIARTLSYGSDV